MIWSDLKRQLLVAVPIVLVLVLSTVALLSLRTDPGPEMAAPQEQTEDAPAAGRTGPGDPVEIEDGTRHLAIGCSPSEEPDIYAVVLENRSGLAADYLVSATLTDEDGRSADVSLDFATIQPGQEREEFVTAVDLASIESCRIAAIESDRWIAVLG
ncbi:MAG: hypothetical protein AAF547_04645 [Actinomycetota bacterium]